MKIKANMGAGFAFINYGQIKGHESEVVIEGETPTTKIVKTTVDVTLIGMGALIEDPTDENIYRSRS